MSEWYYILDETERGPVSEDDLKHIFASGTLPLNTPVWREGMEDWTAAGDCPDLRDEDSNEVFQGNQSASDCPDSSQLAEKTRETRNRYFLGVCVFLLIVIIPWLA